MGAKRGARRGDLRGHKGVKKGELRRREEADAR